MIKDAFNASILSYSYMFTIQHAYNTGTTCIQHRHNIQSTQVPYTDNTHSIKTRIYTHYYILIVISIPDTTAGTGVQDYNKTITTCTYIQLELLLYIPG